MQLGIYSTEQCYFCGSKLERHSGTSSHSCSNLDCSHKHSYGYYNNMGMLYFIIEQYGFYLHSNGKFWIEDMDHSLMLMIVDIKLEKFPEITVNNYQEVVEKYKGLMIFK